MPRQPVLIIGGRTAWQYSLGQGITKGRSAGGPKLFWWRNGFDAGYFLPKKQLAKILLRSGADPMHQDALQRNAFDLALEHENFQMFNHLIRTDGHHLAEPDGPFLSIRKAICFAHLQIVKTKKDKIRTVTTAMEGPFFYNKEWTCHDKDGKELFNFQIRKKHEPTPAEFNSPEKVLAISDIEGNFDAFANLLKGNDVINEAYEWTYGAGAFGTSGRLF